MDKDNNLVGKSMIKVFKENIGMVILLAFAVLGAVITSLIPPHILRYIIDNMLEQNSYSSNKNNKLLELAFAYMGVLLFIGVFEFLKEVILTVLGQKITKEIRYDMMGKLENINTLFFSSNGSGAIVSRFTNDVDAINSLFTDGIVGMMVDCLKIIGIIISIWMFSSSLGVITLLLLPVIYGITRSFQGRMLKAQINNRVLVGKVNNHISESLKNIQMIKSYSKENYMEKNYTNYLLDNYKTIEKVNFYDSIYSPIIQITRAIIIGFIVVLSSKDLNYLGISPGMVAASIELISNLFSPIDSLGMELQNIQQAISGIYRVNDFYNEPEDGIKDNSLLVEDIMKSDKDVMLAFNNVFFQYEEDDYVLKNINLDVKKNEKVAFIGRTGVGKTTLFKLVMGLIKPSSGSITINGVNVYDIPNSKKREIFGYVDQGISIINGTVAEQISLKDDSIKREDIENAVDFVGLTEYVESLENGLDTIVVHDSLFSQGQKQLLAIARAIVLNPPILLLDEITANLDSITEERIVSVLKKASYSHTILSISHRLSSMVVSDRVVILENGSIKNVGSPEELLEMDDWYKSHIELEKLTWG